MDFAKPVWIALNEPWVAAILSILSILVITLTIAEKFHRLTSAITHWKGWNAVARCYKSLQKKYRIRRTKNIMLIALKHEYGYEIGINEYNYCLTENQNSSSRNTLKNITPEKPSWLNDYYVATALESLAEECRIVKAKKFHLDNWPSRPRLYLFSKRKEGITSEQQIDEVETESKCIVYQKWNECLYSPRYTAKGHAETIEPGTTQFKTEYWLKADAPPCSRCWDIKNRQSNIRSLVESITKYDMSATATIEITGRNQEFQEAVIFTCIESQCKTEVATIKKILERAIETRAAQIRTTHPGHKTEWDEQLISDFRSSLSTYIRAELGKTSLQSRE